VAAQNKINLLPPDEFEETPLGQFLKWALTVGRYIVIGTELIVILAFLSRFKLDRDLTNLNEEIKTKMAVIESFEDLEEKTRTLQSQLQAIKDAEGKGLETDQLLDFIDENIPLNVFLADLSLNQDSGLELEGIALSEVDLATFLSRLEESQLFERISLESISHGGEEGPEIEFGLKAEWQIKEEQEQN